MTTRIRFRANRPQTAPTTPAERVSPWRWARLRSRPAAVVVAAAPAALVEQSAASAPGPPPPPPVQITEAEAARFLLQAQFSVTDADLAAIRSQRLRGLAERELRRGARTDRRRLARLARPQLHHRRAALLLAAVRRLHDLEPAAGRAGPDAQAHGAGAVGILRRLAEPDRRLLSAVRHRRVLGRARARMPSAISARCSSASRSTPAWASSSTPRATSRKTPTAASPTRTTRAR